jgi:hypothetical protein
MKPRIGALLAASALLLVIPTGIPAAAQSTTLPTTLPSTATEKAGAAVIRIETTTATWRARQRVSFPLKAAVRQRLIAAGLQVNMGGETASEQHDEAVLTVDYREERGQQVTLDIYGTEVTAQIVLEHPQRGRLLALSIKESPSYGPLSTLPYIDVIQQFETNPSIYFLGDLVRGALEGQEPAAALLAAVTRHADLDAARPTRSQAYPEASESLPSFEPQYEQRAISRAIQDLTRLKQQGAAKLFTKLLTHPDWHIRLQAVLALEGMGAVESPSVLAELARHDPESEVREAARQTLDQLKANPPAH